MKSQFVNDLQEGDRVNDYFVATRCDLRPMQNGGKFLGMVFKDRTGEMGGIMWNNAETVAKLFAVGDVVNVRGTVTSYQGRLQIRTEQVLPLRDDEYDRSDLVETHTKADVYLEKLRAMLDTIKEPALAKLVTLFLDDEEFVKAFSEAVAGKKWHHAEPGGLARHCYEMACVAETMCKLYPNIHRDLLLTAVLLHDAGKLDELSHDLCVDYTTEGKLVGHLYMGAEMVANRIGQIPDFPADLRMQLMHCILSHHGELQFGSPVVPKTLEAIVLYLCDNLDAQADAFTRVQTETRQRNQEWSEYLPLIERPIWAGPFD